MKYAALKCITLTLFSLEVCGEGWHLKILNPLAVKSVLINMVFPGWKDLFKTKVRDISVQCSSQLQHFSVVILLSEGIQGRRIPWPCRERYLWADITPLSLPDNANLNWY